MNTTDPGRAGGRDQRIPRGSGRQRLLDAAEELFAEHGFAATTTRAIAERAGTSTGVVFYHFPSKEALLEALLAERSPRADLDSMLAHHRGDPRTALARLADAIDETIEQRGEVLRIMLRGEDPESSDLLRGYVDGAVETLADYLHGELGEHGLDERRARAGARTFLSAVLFSRLLLGPADPDQYVADAVEVLLHGYGP